MEHLRQTAHSTTVHRTWHKWFIWLTKFLINSQNGVNFDFDLETYNSFGDACGEAGVDRGGETLGDPGCEPSDDADGDGDVDVLGGLRNIEQEWLTYNLFEVYSRFLSFNVSKKHYNN